MPFISATVKTEHGSKYLQQLCKHFAHKVTVDFSPIEGRAVLPPGRCLMQADDETLRLYCDVHEDTGVPHIKDILDQHLEKFAWREALEYDWLEGVPEDCKSVLQCHDFMPKKTDGLVGEIK